MTGCDVKLGIFGVISLGLGLALIPALDVVTHYLITKELTLSPTSFVYDTWANAGNSSAHIYLQVWVWDLQNEHEVLNGAKPFLIEKGPYSYRQSQVKHNITFNDNKTVSYIPVSEYIFLPEMSVGPETDTYTALNAPLVIIANFLRTMPSLVQEFGDIIAELTKDTDPFITLSIRDIIWGYNDPIFQLIYELTGTALVPGPQFGIMTDKNNTAYQSYTVFTGEDDITKLNIIDRWNGVSELPYWTTRYANMINGTDASLNPPFAHPDHPHYVFASTTCRSLNAEFQKPVHIKGVLANKFHMSERALANASVEPDNIGFCTPDAHHCLPSGLLNISNCQHGMPASLSFPHFLYADPRVVLPGMNPNKDEHETFITIHQLTGITMQVAKRIQINMQMKPDKYFKQLSSVAEVFYPMIWLNESFVLSNDEANKFLSSVQTPLKLFQALQFTLIAIGVLSILVAIFLYVRRWVKTGQEKNLKVQAEETTQVNESTALIN